MEFLVAMAVVVGTGALACLLIYLLKPESLAVKFEQWNSGIEEARARCRESDSYWAAAKSAFLWVYEQSRALSAGRPDRWLRIGLQCGLLVAGSIALAILIAVAIYIVLVIAVGYVILKLIGAVAPSGDDVEKAKPEEDAHPDKPLDPMPGSLKGRVESRVWEGLGGYKYTVHMNGDGEKLGESHVRHGIGGYKYVEHLDASGNKLGETHDSVGLGNYEYRRHIDNKGEKVGESHDREGLAGQEYVVHVDKSDEKIGETHQRDGIGGDAYGEQTPAGKR